MPKKTKGTSAKPPRDLARALGRRRPSKMPAPVIAIVCEGKETEPLYFHALAKTLRLTSIRVIPGTGGSAAAVVQRAKKAKAGLSPCGLPAPDEVWCVMDAEAASGHASFMIAVTDAESAHLRAAVSNPAFEFWYILHFVETTRQFADATDAERYLTTFLTGYTKSSTVFDQVYPKTKDAIDRAKRLLKNHPSPGTRFPNPSTGVHELVRRLLEIAER